MRYLFRSRKKNSKIKVVKSFTDEYVMWFERDL